MRTIKICLATRRKEENKKSSAKCEKFIFIFLWWGFLATSSSPYFCCWPSEHYENISNYVYVNILSHVNKKKDGNITIIEFLFKTDVSERKGGVKRMGEARSVF